MAQYVRRYALLDPNRFGSITHNPVELACGDGQEGIAAGKQPQPWLRHPPVVLDYRSKKPPHVHLKRTPAGRYIWRSACMSRPALWNSDPPTSTMNVIRDVHDVFFDWFLKANPHHL